MAFDRLNYAKNWTSAEDFPTFSDSEALVRGYYQYHPDAIKAFINDFLTALEGTDAAGSIGVTPLTSGESTLQAVLANYLARFVRVDEDIEELASGGVPAVTQAVRVAFAATDWTAAQGGGVRYVIPETVHMRPRSAYGYDIWETVEGGSLSSTWNTAATQVVRDDVTGDITLSAPAAYAGAVVFFGL